VSEPVVDKHPVLTVNANAALDRVLFIREFQPTITMRTQHVVDCVGGKGLDASVALACMGVPNTALSFMAGRVGRDLEQLLHNYGITTELVWISGETRIAHVIIESEYHRHSHIITQGYQVSELDLDRFYERLAALIPAGGWVIAGGSLPRGCPLDFYCCVVEQSQLAGTRVLVDCSGEPARQVVKHPPDILKMNRSEFARTFEAPEAEQDIFQLQLFAARLLETYSLPALVITCGGDGILAVTPWASYLAKAPEQQAVNAAGAGDAVSASLAWRLGAGEDWPTALRFAAAASAATVLTAATAESRLEDIQRLLPLAQVEQI